MKIRQHLFKVPCRITATSRSNCGPLFIYSKRVRLAVQLERRCGEVIFFALASERKHNYVAKICLVTILKYEIILFDCENYKMKYKKVRVVLTY